MGSLWDKFTTFLLKGKLVKLENYFDVMEDEFRKKRNIKKCFELTDRQLDDFCVFTEESETSHAVIVMVCIVLLYLVAR